MSRRSKIHGPLVAMVAALAMVAGCGDKDAGNVMGKSGGETTTSGGSGNVTSGPNVGGAGTSAPSGGNSGR